MASSVKSKAELVTAHATAHISGRLGARKGNELELIEDFIDSSFNDETAKTGNYTVVINTDTGAVFTSTLDAIEYQLPGIAVGNVVKFVNMAADGAALLTIKPNSSDGIACVGSLTDDKDLINTKSTAKQGDYVVLASLGSTAFWSVTSMRGIWAKE